MMEARRLRDTLLTYARSTELLIQKKQLIAMDSIAR